MKNLNLSEDKVNALLGMAGKKLGRDPEAIKQDLVSGNVDALTQGLDPKTQAQIGKVLGDPKALEALMQNEQIQKLIGGLGKK